MLNSAATDIVELCEGNPGAITCLCELAKVCTDTEWATLINNCRAHKIVEQYIYIVWNDLLRRDTNATLRALTADIDATVEALHATRDWQYCHKEKS